ncbi:hypothetical protein PABG_03113 [Paracoccidioides brasiliensis Pb03]|uniref:Large ribosomal subunit protein bL28m n=1 Tax=Paracoccidioides brasiliensis (strain Pb18) TaxID=502780 RepID=C1G3Y1_PARBD|nr:mitochondrial 54S ribosomal protein YmL24/YmL14 [Paracoccidioides brasiliensis Pb18]EEH20882.1 hypothetical protein PABG_03113 [Paracoccidioides brasiliensis Pb03]EEH45497.1 hypothetical protein PADG_01647 [Paracoccidioides brasiliensis Pb18]ODH49332.1 hypothetical protein GX48_04543 [Paracoccidioides brasiliensis]
MALHTAKPFSFSRPSSLLQTFRGLSLYPRRSQSNQSTIIDPDKYFESLSGDPPEYPYGPSLYFKQANSGLYGGSTIQFGNKISKGRNKGKTRRTWKPNVRHEELYSEALGTTLKLKVTHRVLRTIKKVGGLDQYLLGDKPARIKELGVFGWKLRWKVMQSKAMREKFLEEQKALGLRAAAELESQAPQQTQDKIPASSEQSVQ